jgi:DNA mismatch repair protein MSH6
LEHLSRKVGCLTLFSTHYHMLTEEVARNPNISLKHMSCRIDDDRHVPPPRAAPRYYQLTDSTCLVLESRKEVTFLYKVADGVCPKSYGMNVARMAVRCRHSCLIRFSPFSR